MTKSMTEPPTDWRVSGIVPLQRAIEEMEERAERLAGGEGSEMIWLLEHPSVITAGRSAREEDLLYTTSIPIVSVKRGGQYTYHGAGQRVVYFALRLSSHAGNIRDFIQRLEGWLTEVLLRHGVCVHSDRRKVGLWVENRKIVAFGLRVSRGIVTHGVAINRDPDLSAYEAFIPCGLAKDRYSITSLVAEGVRVSQRQLDRSLEQTCPFLRR